MAQATIGLPSDWLRKWRKLLSSQSMSVVQGFALVLELIIAVLVVKIFGRLLFYNVCTIVIT